MLHTTYVNKILEDIRASCYLALHFDNPSLAGAYASEISGGGYARQLVAFTEPSSRTIWNTHSVSWNGLPQLRIMHVVGWDSLKQGDPMFVATLEKPINVLEGKGWQVLTGDVAVSL